MAENQSHFVSFRALCIAWPWLGLALLMVAYYDTSVLARRPKMASLTGPVAVSQQPESGCLLLGCLVPQSRLALTET